MNICERLDAPFNCSFQAFASVGLRKIDGCLYSREQVPTSVLCFPSQGRDLLLVSLLLG
jgi:hypothetical protein